MVGDHAARAGSQLKELKVAETLVVLLNNTRCHDVVTRQKTCD